MKNKKGASAILAYVLLISLTVILAVSVTVYMKNKAKTQAEELTETVGTMLDCESVGINAYLEGNTVNVKNVGSKNVSIELRYQNNDDNQFVSVNVLNHNGDEFLMPRDVRNLDSPASEGSKDVSRRKDKVDVIPKILINKKKIGCIDKKVTVG